MTDEQINIKIAELCGWAEIEPCTCCKGQSRGVRPEGSQHKKHLPNYAADLNACHELEKTLTHINDWMLYDKALAETTEGFNFHATARQRCEAFLRVHGQWEEEA